MFTAIRSFHNFRGCCCHFFMPLLFFGPAGGIGAQGYVGTSKRCQADPELEKTAKPLLQLSPLVLRTESAKKLFSARKLGLDMNGSTSQQNLSCRADDVLAIFRRQAWRLCAEYSRFYADVCVPRRHGTKLFTHTISEIVYFQFPHLLYLAASNDTGAGLAGRSRSRYTFSSL